MRSRYVVDELRLIAARATKLAEEMTDRSDHGVLAVDVLLDVTPVGARLNAYQAMSYQDRPGRWYCHVVMPLDWRPRDARGWMSGDDENQPFWNSVSGDSKDEVLRSGLKLLLDATSNSRRVGASGGRPDEDL